MSRDSAIWIELDEREQAFAAELGRRRIDELSRHTSPDFKPSLNPMGQARGAAGEIATAKWLRQAGFNVAEGFVEDDPTQCDITVNGFRVEVMTTRVADRAITGTCVPPGKLRAARRRGAWGYVFAATEDDDLARVLIQAVAVCDDIDHDPSRVTSVGSASRENYVVRESHLSHPSTLLTLLAEELR